MTFLLCRREFNFYSVVYSGKSKRVKYSNQTFNDIDEVFASQHQKHNVYIV